MSLGLVQFPDFAALVGSSRIEVSQAGKAQAVGTIVRFQGVLKEELGDAVGIYWLSGSIFGDRNAWWVAVNRASRGKNYLFHSRIERGVQQRKASFNVVAKIFAGICDRFAHVGVRRKMHDGIHPLQAG